MNKNGRTLYEALGEEAYNKIGEAVGAATMCWENINAAGVFESEKAGKIVNELCWFIVELIENKHSTEQSCRNCKYCIKGKCTRIELPEDFKPRICIWWEKKEGNKE